MKNNPRLELWREAQGMRIRVEVTERLFLLSMTKTNDSIFNLKECNHGAREVAQWIKCLMCKNKEWSLTPQNP